MKDDSISRRAAIDALCKVGCGSSYCGVPCIDVEAIELLPSVDRPSGEWIEFGTIGHRYKCSVCGRTIFHTTAGKNHVAEYYPYCRCGAKMKGADDE